MCSTDTKSEKVNLTIESSDGRKYQVQANTVRDLALPSQFMVPIAEGLVGRGRLEIVQPRILVGMDNTSLITSREVRVIKANSDVLESRTALGWVRHGVCSMIRTDESSVLAVNETPAPTDGAIEQLIRAHFAVDSIGITTTMRVKTDDLRAMQIMEATTRQRSDGFWETGLLWRRQEVYLPDSEETAKRRWAGIQRKMDKDPAFATAYREKMRYYIQQGFAEILSPAEREQIGSRRWYLPHFAVFNPRKPKKIRIVFDAASKCKGVALNNALLSGPDLLSSLLGNIFRFREGRIALAADIRDMFLRIKIVKPDQESQLFIWNEPGEEPQTYKMTSMVFGATCSPSSAQYVRDKIADSAAAQFPEAAAVIKNKFYMDDMLSAVDTKEEAVMMARQVSEILRRGKMELTNWASNDADVLEHIAPHLRAVEPVQIIGADMITERVLGVSWDPAADKFLFKFIDLPELKVEDRPTKRQVLSAVMRIFDPVGFLACVMIRSKILLQAVWRSKVDWDQPIQVEHANKWRMWQILLRKSDCAIPRQCISSRHRQVTLHIFCDASELACCAVAYFVEKIDGFKKVNFIAAKTKVAPLKPLSVPRLELQAALIAARLAATIKKEFTCRIENVIFWTDSTTVLCWLRTDPRTYSAFVANRLGEIDELTSAANWKWVPTKYNSADIGTRDGEPPDLSPSGPWFSGPAFLKKDESEWPREKTPPQPDKEILEMRPTTIAHIQRARLGDGALPDVHRFSSWTRLIRATAWVRRFAWNARHRTQRLHHSDLLADERDGAERAWIRRAQEDAFGHEIQALQRGEPPPRTGRLYTVTPHIDTHGIIRMGTRLIATSVPDIPAGLREPIILDGSHPYTRLMIRHYHERRNHPGPEVTVSDVRENYFIFRLRPAVRRAHFECQVCRIRRSKPQSPLMGQLPNARLAHHLPPFTHCGLDYFGPIQVTIGRRREKMYGALFTCLTTRAVHLELASSLSADSAVMALRRMAARRGQPRYMYSDNGTNFKGAAKEIAAALMEIKQAAQMKDHLAAQNIDWAFNPPLAPHMGGAWESLVRSVKRALEMTLKDRAPRVETLLTALAEAEFTVNSRPLTHVSVDPDDGEPLTPNHILMNTAGRHMHLAAYGPLDEQICLKKQWQFSQQLADMFWRRWMREYLPTLAQRRKWQEPAPPVCAGRMAIIADAALPRNSWPRGIITQAIPAADGQIRIVRIKTSTGEYTRPVTKIVVLPTEPIQEAAAHAADQDQQPS